MHLNPLPQNNLSPSGLKRKLLSSFLLPLGVLCGIAFAGAPFVSAQAILSKDIPGVVSKKSPALSPLSAGGPVAGQDLRLPGVGGLEAGFDPDQKPSWSNWRPMPEFNVEGPEFYSDRTPAGPVTALESLDVYKISPNENPVTVALKIDDMIRGFPPRSSTPPPVILSKTACRGR